MNKLDRLLELPRYYRANTEVIEQDGAEVLYVVEATDLKFKRGYLRGTVSLAKFRKVCGFQYKFSWRGFRFSLEKVPSVRWRKLWDRDTHDLGSSGEILVNRGWQGSAEISNGYWEALVSKSANAGINLTEHLRALVLGALERKLVDHYNLVFGGKRAKEC